MSPEQPPVQAPQVGDRDIHRREVVCIDETKDIVAAARLMREKHIGFLVVVTASGAESPDRRVVGVLTDRDIVVAVVAREADPHSLTVGDVMTRNPLLVGSDCPLDAALGFMRDAGVRRAPVIGSRGELSGVLAVDDVIEKMAQQLTSIAGSIRGEQRTERMVRP